MSKSVVLRDGSISNLLILLSPFGGFVADLKRRSTTKIESDRCGQTVPFIGNLVDEIGLCA